MQTNWLKVCHRGQLWSASYQTILLAGFTGHPKSFSKRKTITAQLTFGAWGVSRLNFYSTPKTCARIRTKNTCSLAPAASRFHQAAGWSYQTLLVRWCPAATRCAWSWRLVRYQMRTRALSPINNQSAIFKVYKSEWPKLNASYQAWMECPSQSNTSWPEC